MVYMVWSMLVESDASTGMLGFVVVMSLLFLCKISQFPIIIYLTHNFLLMDLLLQAYLFFISPFPCAYAEKSMKNRVPTSPPSDETKRDNETMKSKFLALVRCAHSTLQETRSMLLFITVYYVTIKVSRG